MFQLPKQSPTKILELIFSDQSSSLVVYLESSHDQWNNNITLLLGHLCADSEQHEHVVALDDAHGVQITQDIGTCDLSHHVRIVDDRIEEVGGLNETQTAVAQRRDGAVEPDPDAWNGHVHELIVVRGVVLLQRADQLVEHILGYLAAAPLQIGESRESEVGVEIVSGGIELSAQQVAAHLQLQVVRVIAHVARQYAEKIEKSRPLSVMRAEIQNKSKGTGMSVTENAPLGSRYKSEYGVPGKVRLQWLPLEMP